MGKIVALTDTGHRARTHSGTNALAHDDDGSRVCLVVSDEAVQDHDWPAIWRMAEAKCAAGKFDVNGEVRFIRITTGDWSDNAQYSN